MFFPIASTETSPTTYLPEELVEKQASRLIQGPVAVQQLFRRRMKEKKIHRKKEEHTEHGQSGGNTHIA